MGYRIGSSYFGSDSLQTSTSNVEIIQQHKPVGYDGVFEAYKFALNNLADCTVKINDSDAIFLKANQGFSSDYYDAGIYSFVVVTNAIQFNYIGAYK